MDEKVKLIGDWLHKEHNVKELGEHYQVSRKTVYKWIRRYEEGGVEALSEASRAPHRHPNATSPEIVTSLIEAKIRHKDWGPKKVVSLLGRQRPDMSWPAASTVQSILRKEGLVRPRHLRRHTPLLPIHFRNASDPTIPGA